MENPNRGSPDNINTSGQEGGEYNAVIDIKPPSSPINQNSTDRNEGLETSKSPTKTSERVPMNKSINKAEKKPPK